MEPPTRSLSDELEVPTTPDPALAIVRRAKAGDAEAFGDLVERFWRPMVGLARAVLGSRRVEAEDVVQDSFVAAWRRVGSLRRLEAFEAWLSRIVVRRCYRVTRRPAADEAPELAVPPPSHLRLDLERHLTRLSPRQRAVLYLTSFEGLEDSEIARRLGTLPSTVRVHRMRARRKLRRLLGGPDD